MLQKLLQSTHCYQPPTEDDVERFITEFHARRNLEALKPSLFKNLQEHLQNFFSFFYTPVFAYSGATLLALFVSVLILRSPSLNHHPHATPLFSERFQAPLNYVSSPALQQLIEPVTFELDKKSEESKGVISPLTFILKRKASPSVKDF